MIPHFTESLSFHFLLHWVGLSGINSNPPKKGLFGGVRSVEGCVCMGVGVGVSQGAKAERISDAEAKADDPTQRK